MCAFHTEDATNWIQILMWKVCIALVRVLNCFINDLLRLSLKQTRNKNIFCRSPNQHFVFLSLSLSFLFFFFYFFFFLVFIFFYFFLLLILPFLLFLFSSSSSSSFSSTTITTFLLLSSFFSKPFPTAPLTVISISPTPQQLRMFILL